MRKIFAIFAAALIAFSFASCDQKGTNTPSDPTEKGGSDKHEPLKFTIAISDVTETSAHVTITPTNMIEEYFWLNFPKDYLMDEKGVIGSVNEFIKIMLSDPLYESYEAVKKYLPNKAGKLDEVLTNLDPGIEYFVCAFSLDSNLNIVNDYVAMEYFTTSGTAVPEGYVDLGLPSGTLWAEESVQCLVSYDDAMDFYGNAIPSQTQWEELMNNCTWTYGELDDNIYGFTVKGSNGNTINILCQGSKTCQGAYDEDDMEGWYWTSTPDGENTAYVAFFSHYPTYDNMTTDALWKCSGFSVHLIYFDR